MKEKKIIEYTLKNGKSPYNDWYSKLDKSSCIKIAVRLKRLQIGLYGDYKRLSKHICELKFKNGIRIYYTEKNDQIILLLLGGNKTRQSNDIKKAQEYLNEFIEREKNG